MPAWAFLGTIIDGKLLRARARTASFKTSLGKVAVFYLIINNKGCSYTVSRPKLLENPPLNNTCQGLGYSKSHRKYEKPKLPSRTQTLPLPPHLFTQGN